MRGFKSVLLVLPLPLLLGGWAMLRSREPVAVKREAQQAESARSDEKNDPIFSDWIALGSGCRARPNDGGDVDILRHPEVDPLAPHAIDFRLVQYRLLAAPGDTDPPLNFARECAVRVAVKPPPGTRIKSVSAKTTVTVNKSAHVDLAVSGELKLGSASIARNVDESKDGAIRGRRIVQSLDSRAPGASPFPELKCEQPKVLGYDYTWIAKRSTADESVDVYLADDTMLSFTVELEACPPGLAVYSRSAADSK